MDQGWIWIESLSLFRVIVGNKHGTSMKKVGEIDYDGCSSWLECIDSYAGARFYWQIIQRKKEWNKNESVPVPILHSTELEQVWTRMEQVWNKNDFLEQEWSILVLLSFAVNAAENTIQTFKSHLILILCQTQSQFINGHRQYSP